MQNNKARNILAVVLCVVLIALGPILASKRNSDDTATQGDASQTQSDTGVFSPVAEYEYLVGSAVYQLSAESNALMQQAFATATAKIDAMVSKCENSEDKWEMTTDSEGNKAMMYDGKRVAVICDIDDTLVDGVHYTCDIVGNNGDYNNAAFCRFVMSDGCTALPGAVDFVKHCVAQGVEVYYITNRYDQGYKIGQSDKSGSYEESIKEKGSGAYVKADGTEIGSSIYQVFGKSFYDITMESMQKLGFPIDDQHLILNDSKLNGSSKEKARQAIINGAEAYPNGQRAGENTLKTAETIKAEPHHIALLLGDQMTDFTDSFSDEKLTAVTRTELVAEYTEKFGNEWILLPNAVYGAAFDSAMSHGIPKLLENYSYVK